MIYNNLGIAYQEQSNYQTAKEYLEKALKIRLGRFGENHPEVAKSYSSIGALYEKQGINQLAIDYFKKAIIIRENLLDKDHLDLASSHNNLGVLYEKQGDYLKSLEHLEKVLCIRVKQFTEDNNLLTLPLNNTRNLLQNSEAIEFFIKEIKQQNTFVIGLLGSVKLILIQLGDSETVAPLDDILGEKD
jgi:tetratricopeptide (TPR) repeat protein